MKSALSDGLAKGSKDCVLMVSWELGYERVWNANDWRWVMKCFHLRACFELVASTTTPFLDDSAASWSAKKQFLWKEDWSLTQMVPVEVLKIKLDVFWWKSWDKASETEFSSPANYWLYKQLRMMLASSLAVIIWTISSWSSMKADFFSYPVADELSIWLRIQESSVINLADEPNQMVMMQIYELQWDECWMQT
jgi:hypothetical protein